MTNENLSGNGTFKNPIIWSDIPDVDVIRVGDAYYMSSTTMYFNPGVPIMKSYDLVNWEIVSYVYDILEDADNLALRNGKHAYGGGTWASSIRYHNGTYYLAVASFSTGKTYIFQTEDAEKSNWRKYTLNAVYHDMSLLFDDDGRVYLVYGGGTLRLIELTSDATAVKDDGLNQVIIPLMDAAGNTGLVGEGSHIYKLNGKYYIFIISWPRGEMRTEVCYRSDSIQGPYEGRVILRDDLGYYAKAGVAQGGIVDTPDGKWYAMLFQDHGAVGRIPVLVPVEWDNDGWPVLGVDGKVPHEMEYPAAEHKMKYVVTSDEFASDTLPLEWQWNHNPVNDCWSLAEREGWLRLKTARVCTRIEEAVNTLTQRTFGPECCGSICIDVSEMKDGDVSGLSAFQKKYGFAAVEMKGDEKSIVMVNADSREEKIVERIPLTQNQNLIYLRVYFDFRDNEDKAYFSYKLSENEDWISIGDAVKMEYLLDHFSGYRFALFNYATKELGGYVDFDYFRIENQ